MKAKGRQPRKTNLHNNKICAGVRRQSKHRVWKQKNSYSKTESEAATDSTNRERLTGQKGDRGNAQHQSDIVILYSSPAPMCWLWEHHLRLTTLFLQYRMPNTLPAPIFLSLCSPTLSHWAHTIALWWGVNDWRRNEVKRERITGIQKKHLEKLEMGKKRAREREQRVVMQNTN